MRSILFGLVFAGSIVACVSSSNSDPSVYLTGTEESYITGPGGEKECNGHKVLICHIPPGNPANAHTICVDKHAVDPHVTHHGDGIGACATEPTDPPSDPPPNDDPPGGDDPPGDDPTPPGDDPTPPGVTTNPPGGGTTSQDPQLQTQPLPTSSGPVL